MVEVAVSAKRKNGKVPVPEKSDAEERKEWFLAQLRKGRRRDATTRSSLQHQSPQQSGLWAVYLLR